MKEKYQSNLDCLKKKNVAFDYKKLKRTAIKGIPCEFIPHRTGGGEIAKKGQLNIRKEVWKRLIEIEALKQECLDKFNQENQTCKLNSPIELFNHFKDQG